MIDLKAKPFFLNDRQIAWVEDTLERMSDDQKAEQLFCPMLQFTDKGFIDQIVGNHEFGAFMMRINGAEDTQEACNYLQAKSEIPVLIAANFEDGGNGIMNEGTYMGRQMLIAATDEEEQAYQIGRAHV